MSKKVDFVGKQYEDLSTDDKQYLFDRNKLPGDWVVRFSAEIQKANFEKEFAERNQVSSAQLSFSPSVEVAPKTFDEMSKVELQNAAKQAGVVFPSNASYETLLKKLKDNSTDDDDDDDEDDEDDEDDD